MQKVKAIQPKEDINKLPEKKVEDNFPSTQREK